MESVIDTLSQPGVLSATLATIARHCLWRSVSQRIDAHCPVPVLTLALSGEHDGCVASDVFERLTVASITPKA